MTANKLRGRAQFSKLQVGIFAALLAVVGIVIVVASHASGYSASVEPENGSVTAPASVVSDSTASGGSKVTFNDPNAGGGGGGANPSGQAMPSGNLVYNGHTFTRNFADDFTTNCALGSFPCAAYSSNWGNYSDGTPDTCGKGGCGGTSVYYPSKVLSVSNGELDWYLHTENGVHMSAAPFPNTQRQTFTYGAYSFRLRSDSLPGFKTAWLLWPATWAWTNEIDFPEGDLNGGIGYFGHCQNNASANCAGGGSSALYADWHTLTLVWVPGRVDFLIDGSVIGSQTSGVSSEAMQLILQTESCFDDPSACPANSTAGHLDLDWIVMYSY